MCAIWTTVSTRSLVNFEWKWNGSRPMLKLGFLLARGMCVGWVTIFRRNSVAHDIYIRLLNAFRDYWMQWDVDNVAQYFMRHHLWRHPHRRDWKSRNLDRYSFAQDESLFSGLGNVFLWNSFPSRRRRYNWSHKTSFGFWWFNIKTFISFSFPSFFHMRIIIAIMTKKKLKWQILLCFYIF